MAYTITNTYSGDTDTYTGELEDAIAYAQRTYGPFPNVSYVVSVVNCTVLLRSAHRDTFEIEKV